MDRKKRRKKKFKLKFPTKKNVLDPLPKFVCDRQRKKKNNSTITFC